MQTTLDLLDRALAVTKLSERKLAEQLGYSPNACASSRNHGSLSPVMAGQLAELVGEPVQKWIALAALEASSPARTPAGVRQRLLRAIA